MHLSYNINLTKLLLNPRFNSVSLLSFLFLHAFNTKIHSEEQNNIAFFSNIVNFQHFLGKEEDLTLTTNLTSVVCENINKLVKI